MLGHLTFWSKQILDRDRFSSEETSMSKGSKHGSMVSSFWASIELKQSLGLLLLQIRQKVNKETSWTLFYVRSPGVLSKVRFRVCRVSFLWSFCIWPVIITRPTPEAHSFHRLGVELLGFLMAGDVWLRV